MDRSDIVDEFERVNAVQFGEFDLSHGGKSNYYIDKYRFETDPACLQLIVEQFANWINEETLAGVALGAVPLVTAVSLETQNKFVIARKKQKSHGTGNKIEGRLSKDEEVIVIEDVTTTGRSALNAVQSIRSAGGNVNKTFVVVDREEGARQLLSEHEVDLSPILTADDLLSSKSI